MVGGLRAMNSKQLPPTCAEALGALRALFSQCTYPDLDPSVHADANRLLARRQVAEASIQRLEIELGLRDPPRSRRTIEPGRRKALKRRGPERHR
jgi:hypothetical protein